MLTLALPSKGRLKEATEDYFSKIGLPIIASGGSRDYTGKLSNIENVQVLFLQASEIAYRLGDGSIDLGITGYDLLAENKIIDKTHIFKKLDFGYADLVFAVPESWIDVQSILDLDDIMFYFRKNHGMRFRIATKYINLTTQFLREHKIHDYRLIESQGATEGAPAAGVAEAVVDITSTGSTLRDNHLKIVLGGVMLKSQAVLAAGLNQQFSGEKLDLIRRILEFVSANNIATNHSMIQAAFTETIRNDVTHCLINHKAQDIHIHTTGFTAIIDNKTLYRFCEELRALGVHLISVHKCQFVFQTPNAEYDLFLANLGINRAQHD